MPNPPAELVLNARPGVRIIVPGSLRQTTTYVLLEQEDWFEDEIHFVRAWLRPGMRALDVGANLGLYSLSMAHAVGAAGQVCAFEAVPDTARVLGRSVELNGMRNVEVRAQAASDRAGRVALVLDERSEENAIAPAGRGGPEVDAVTLDEALASAAVDFIKIDVEGHEKAVVRGAEGLLRAQSPLVMFEIKQEGRLNLEAADALAALGYSVFRLLPGTLLLEPFDPEAPDPAILNLFACKPDRAQALASAGFLSAAPDMKARLPGAAAWTDYAAAAPYSAHWASQWKAQKSAGSRPYLEGLAAYIASRDRKRTAAERHGLLYRAQELVRESLDVSESLARRISLARLIDEAGERSAAVELMRRNFDEAWSSADQALAEPFLAPSARFESIAPADEGVAWLRCAITEQLEKRRRYSSMFSLDTTHTLLAGIMANRFRSAEMERAWQLVDMRRGKQMGPRASALLSARTPENLNPEFWASQRLPAG